MTEYIQKINRENETGLIVRAIERGFVYRSSNYGKSGTLTKNGYKILIEQKGEKSTMLKLNKNASELTDLIKN